MDGEAAGGPQAEDRAGYECIGGTRDSSVVSSADNVLVMDWV